MGQTRARLPRLLVGFVFDQQVTLSVCSFRGKRRKLLVGRVTDQSSTRDAQHERLLSPVRRVSVRSCSRVGLNLLLLRLRAASRVRASFLPSFSYLIFIVDDHASSKGKPKKGGADKGTAAVSAGGVCV